MSYINCDNCGKPLDLHEAIPFIHLDGSMSHLCLDCHRRNKPVEDWIETLKRYKNTNTNYFLLDAKSTNRALKLIRKSRSMQDSRLGDQSDKSKESWLYDELIHLSGVVEAMNNNDDMTLEQQVLRLASTAVAWLEYLNKNKHKKEERSHE